MAICDSNRYRISSTASTPEYFPIQTSPKPLRAAIMQKSVIAYSSTHNTRGSSPSLISFMLMIGSYDELRTPSVSQFFELCKCVMILSRFPYFFYFYSIFAWFFHDFFHYWRCFDLFDSLDLLRGQGNLNVQWKLESIQWRKFWNYVCIKNKYCN